MCTNSDAEGQKFDRSVLLRFHTKYYNKRRPVSEFRHVRLLHEYMIMPHHLHVHLSSISSIHLYLSRMLLRDRTIHFLC